MNVFVCLDDKNGMMFVNRRQSRDAVVIEKIISMVADRKLWMNSYSAKIFADYNGLIQVDDAFLDKADHDEFCFVEDQNISPYLPKINQIVVFKWNRHYPADRYFDVVLENTWKLVATEEFSGNSHEKITMEIYVA